MKMINKKIQFGLLPMMFSLVCFLLSSCFNDVYDDISTTDSTNVEGNTASIRFQISTGEMGDLNATRDNGNGNDPGQNNPNAGQVDMNEGGNSDAQEPAVDGEYINTLCVFVLNTDSVIEAKIEPDLTGTDAISGNLPNYTSEAFEVPAGDKMFYAFANWDNTESEEWLALIDKEVGEKITPSDVDFEVEAEEHVDIANGKYIPMSVIMTGVTISPNDLNFTREIQLRLDRLVAKMYMTINGDDSRDLTIGNLLFSGTAKTVPLISLASTGGATTTLPDSYFDDDPHVVFSNQKISAGEAIVDTFYINESYRGYMASGGSGFTITLDLAERESNDKNQYDRYDGTEYTAVTPRVNIQRNSVYPIELTLDTYTAQFSVTAKTAPIGAAEVSYTTDANWNNLTDCYYIELRDVTTSFTITPTIYDSDSQAVSATWSLSDSETSDNISISGPTNGVFTVTDLTATPGYSYEFSLTATWSSSSGENNAGTTNTVTHTRTYKIRVVFTDGEFSVSGGAYQIAPQWGQVLSTDRLNMNMTMKRENDF
ncbi:MAG: hypothetical protein LUD48_00680 [Prevotella sp.]|nr:hypothetical protein [Prevotella sp.]